MLVCGLIGYAIGNTKGQPWGGFLFGMLLGPLGWLLTLVSGDVRPTCSECGGVIVEGARRCKNCGVEFGKKTQPVPTPAPNPDDDHGRTVILRFSARVLKSPEICACCCEPAETTIEAVAERVNGVRVIRVQERAWEIPYCRKCVRHAGMLDEFRSCEVHVTFALRRVASARSWATRCQRLHAWCDANRVIASIALGLLGIAPWIAAGTYQAVHGNVGKSVGLFGASIAMGALAGILGWFGWPSIVGGVGRLSDRMTRSLNERAAQLTIAERVRAKVVSEFNLCHRGSCCTTDWAAEYLGWKGTIHTFRFYNREFARAFQRANSEKVVM